MSLAEVKNVIAIAAGKGGVGKSCIAANLALALKKSGFFVGLLDADIYGPSQVQMLPKGLFPCPNPENPEEILPGETAGIKLISVAHLRGGENGAIVRAPIANSIIGQFIHQVQWGMLDYLIIDFPPGTGDIQLSLLQQISFRGAVVITTPQEVALLDVRKAIQMFEQMQVPVLGVIENMSYFENPNNKEKYFPFGKGGGEKLAQEFDLPFLGQIPLDPLISQCGDQSESIFDKFPHASACLIFDTLANEVEKLVQEHEYLINFELIWKNAPIENRIEIHNGYNHLQLRAIYQIDAHHFGIEWIDGLISTYQLAEIQRLCPCARCKELRELDHSFAINPDVQISSMRNLGSYALKINFTSGCSRGIYSFSLLRKLKLCV